MRLLGRHNFPNNDDEASHWFFIWGTEIKDALWREVADVLRQFPNAIHSDSSTFIFIVGSTGFEMEVSICFIYQIVIINEIRKRV